jgi:hypothetical protein
MAHLSKRGAHRGAAAFLMRHRHTYRPRPIANQRGDGHPALDVHSPMASRDDAVGPLTGRMRGHLLS